MDLDLHDILAFLVLGEGECDGDVGEIFGEFSCVRVRLGEWND